MGFQNSPSWIVYISPGCSSLRLVGSKAGQESKTGDGDSPVRHCQLFSAECNPMPKLSFSEPRIWSELKSLSKRYWIQVVNSFNYLDGKNILKRVYREMKVFITELLLVEEFQIIEHAPPEDANVFNIRAWDHAEGTGWTIVETPQRTQNSVARFGWRRTQ